MDTWTIIATIMTGILFGFFLFAGGIALFIHLDDRKRSNRAGKSAYRREAVSLYMDVYDVPREMAEETIDELVKNK